MDDYEKVYLYGVLNFSDLMRSITQRRAPFIQHVEQINVIVGQLDVEPVCSAHFSSAGQPVQMPKTVLPSSSRRMS